MKAIKVIGWFFFGLDAIALLFLLSWALGASDREGERAYAIVFLLFTMVLVGVGGAGLVFSGKRGSVLGLWCSTIWLGIPPVIAVAKRISNSL